MQDNKEGQKLLDIEAEVRRLGEMADRAEEEAVSRRFYLEQNFRETTKEDLGKLLADVNGWPYQTHKNVQAIQESLAAYEKKLDEVIKIKEDQIPRWLLRLFVGLAIGLAALVPVAMQVILILLQGG
jgi:hypothetical protein